MYQFSYGEIMQDGLQDARSREYLAMERAIELLELAQEKGAHSLDAAKALDYVNMLWRMFLEDLARPENDLPEVLRADLISIGIWITKEIKLVRMGMSKNFAGLAEVCAIIRDGLK
jgi:flagellar biosynthesis activator protein FlaF